MNEEQGLNFCRELGIPFFRTGSREICNPAPTDTDVDFVILDKGYKIDLEKAGFVLCGSDGYDLDENDFCAYRLGEVNIIHLHNQLFYNKWKIATAACKQMNLTKKVDRLRVFQGVLYGNWEGEFV